MTLNDLEWPFCVKILFCAGMFGALKPGFRSLATLNLVVNVVGELYKEKNSCDITRFSCDSTAFLFHHYLKLVLTYSEIFILYYLLKCKNIKTYCREATMKVIGPVYAADVRLRFALITPHTVV